jgi:peptidase E
LRWSEEIKTVCYTDAPTVAEALEKYRAGKLTEAMAADVERHWV